MSFCTSNWFTYFTTWCRKWSWFDYYIYGKSQSQEDFCRNPAEVLRDECFPFVFKDVNAKSMLLLRLGFIPYDQKLVKVCDCEACLVDPKVPVDLCDYTYQKILVPNSWGFMIGKYRFELGLWNPWYTKYPNCGFMFQLALSFWKTVIPIPYFSMTIRWSKLSYFQTGFGWAAQRQSSDNKTPEYEKYNACLSAKFRFASFMKELEFNPYGETYGFYEGTN